MKAALLCPDSGCVCNSLGTNRSKAECDRVDGQCPCLPGVEGQRCDRCQANHWNLASRNGCTACNCDPTGSESLQCNEVRCHVTSAMKAQVTICMPRVFVISKRFAVEILSTDLRNGQLILAIVKLYKFELLLKFDL